MREYRTIAALLLAGFWLAACSKDTRTYTITIDPVPTGGTISLDPDESEYDETTIVSVTAEPEEGYTFDSWGGDLSGSDNPIELTMDSDKTITAVFTADPVTYSILIDPTPTGGSIAIDPAFGPYEAGTDVTVTATPAAGYTFDSWSGDLSGSTNPETLHMDSDKTISATFTADPVYTLTIDPTPENGSINLAPAGGTYPDGTNVTVTATANLGYSFTSWSGDLSGSTNPETLTMDSDKTISGTFTYDGDVYVREDGDDLDPGTPEEPVATIQRAFEIIAADDGAGTIHIAAGTYTVDYSAGTHLTAVEGVNLLGGYSATDWTDRDVTDIVDDATYRTVIDDVSASGSTAMDLAARVIDVGTGITSATIFEGLYITGGNAGAQYTTGVYIDGGTPTFTSCYVNGGGGEGTTAVYIMNASGMTFSGNHVIGGDMVDVFSRGIYAESSTLTITDNTIDGGCGGGNISTGLYADTVTFTELSGNLIIGGTGEEAWGIVIDSDGTGTIAGNTIHVSNDTGLYGSLTGIFTSATGVDIINNVINVNGQLGWHYPTGIIVEANDIEILNNTIQVSTADHGSYLGISDWGTLTGIVVENNIILSEGGTDTGTAIDLGAADSIANNDIAGWDQFLYFASVNVTDLDTTTITTTAGTGTLESFGNVSIALIDNGGVDYLVDPDGADDDLSTTEDNDWHLVSDAVTLNVREGGLDLSSVTSFPVDGSGDPIDLEDTVRTAGTTSATNAGAAGWSMGAYEQD